MSLTAKLLARKPIEALCAQAEAPHGTAALRRSVGFFALTCFGVGSTVGAGIFVLTGTVAAENAGPAVALCFVLASIVCLLAGLCYAELASMIPVAGSAYSYTYATLGEFVAWIVGWCLILEYLFSCSLVAIGWSGYLQSSLESMGWHVPALVARAPLDFVDSHLVATGSIFDLPAVFVTAFCTAIMLGGIRLSAYFNNAVVVAKVIAILIVVFAGIAYVHPENWRPFVPASTAHWGTYGWSGVLRGTAILFFAYIGFDAVSTMGQEAHRPQRTIPASLIASLAICAVLYLAVSLVITGMVSYHRLGVPDPMYVALAAAGPALAWAKFLIAFVAVFGLISVLLVTLLGQVRIFYAMGRDGLLPDCFARVHPRTHTPHVSTWVTGIGSALIAGVFPLNLLGELISIGTLLAFAIVCGGVLMLRQTQPDTPRPFRVPGAPFVPIAGMAACVALMFTLPGDTWKRLVVWLGVGLLVYGYYGVHHSRLRSASGDALLQRPS